VTIDVVIWLVAAVLLAALILPSLVKDLGKAVDPRRMKPPVKHKAEDE
jgi:Sec-independent protein translocase protein TatA